MTEKSIILRIKKALREHACVGILRQMHFGVAFYVVPEGYVCGTPCRQKPRGGEITSTIYEEWYDMVPDWVMPDWGKAIEVYRQGFYGEFPWRTVLRRLKERRLVA